MAKTVSLTLPLARADLAANQRGDAGIESGPGFHNPQPRPARPHASLE